MKKYIVSEGRLMDFFRMRGELNHLHNWLSGINWNEFHEYVKTCGLENIDELFEEFEEYEARQGKER